ncbi:uncharacterized protein BDZ83DRAFT_653480 [Colletotrichum acutatum]|uniref:Uncharacterized protein n=1 Tax=Glomerella acutata TaxID=27357 RepID=A0AAD8UJZ1_GLOAC|nr:uncharacterized protein BDZ83DRAFT_653480 [Colletotrichum acutatum]KAK1722918.1 hypothetical protein BDZ83DRAFT_653480 [Colletotrichum acutatum]
MDSPGVPLYRTLLLKIQRPDSSILSTEEKELLYVTPDGFIGGTGPMSSYLMQRDMMDERAEIIHYSAQPVCQHVWNFQTKSGSFRVMFTSQWQEFARLHKYISREGSRYMATTCFPQTPGEVIVQMFPSGRIVGRAAQTWFSHRDSPILCSIDTGIEEHDRIVIFRPQNQKLATVLSQALPVATTASLDLAAQTNLCPVTKSDYPNFMSSEERPWMQLQEDRGLENTPHLATTTGDSCESCTVAGNQILDGADSSAEAREQRCIRPLGSRTQHDPQERDLNFSPAASEQHPGIGHPQSSPCREYAADDRCIVVRPWQ